MKTVSPILHGTDQQTLDSENVFGISYDEQENILQLSNSGSTLEINTLLLGCSTKSNNADTVGQFGEGYKIAALVLNRLGKHSLYIITVKMKSGFLNSSIQKCLTKKFSHLR